MTPSQIGSYAIEKKIGAGGMGTVYLGRHEVTGEPAAVKVLPASLAREEGFVVRFTREIESLKQLTNPHVVSLLESGVDDETYYYAMEYVEGETIGARLRREKRIPWQEAVEIAIQVCSALKAAHDAGIVHRDLKPSNLMVTADGTVKLTDFGVAQVFAARKLTATGGIVGTAEYMSPEQAQGKRATKKSDLYSLGAVLYVMLTGRPPFTGKTSLDVIQKHTYGQFDRPSAYAADVPHWLDEIVAQLLEKDPDKRFPNAYVLSLRLREVLKKVSLANEDRTVASDSSGSYDGTAPTVAAQASDHGPGSGTIMRDLMRVEIERMHRPSRIGSWFDNIWVLLASLALLIAGGIWWIQTMDRDTTLTDAQPSAIKSEADRLINRSRHLETIGDTQLAEETLTALKSWLDDEVRRAESPLTTALQVRVERELKQFHKRCQERYDLVESRMQLADQRFQDGQTQEARRIWSEIVRIYSADQDPQMREHVNEAQQRLDQEITARK